MRLDIYSLKGIVYEGEITSVNLKTAAGEITVLKNHRPLISLLKKGKIKITDAAGTRQELDASGGFLEVTPHSLVKILLG